MPAVVFDPRKDSRAQSQLAAQQRAVAGLQNKVPGRQPSANGSAGRPVNQRVDLASTQTFRGNEGNDMMFPGKGRQPMAGTGGVKPANPRGGGNASSTRRYDPPAPNEPPHVMGSLAAAGETRTKITGEQAASFAQQMQNPPAGTGGIKPTREMAEAMAVYGLGSAGISPPPGGSTPEFENALDRWKQQNSAVGNPRSREYGAFLNLPPGSKVPKDFVDRDGDRIDDRYQTGPGQPRGGGAGGGKPGSSAGSSTSSRANPLSGVRGPRSYMGMEDRVRAGARSTAELKARLKERMGGSRYA